jgi:hypothetical protein
LTAEKCTHPRVTVEPVIPMYRNSLVCLVSDPPQLEHMHSCDHCGEIWFVPVKVTPPRSLPPTADPC